MPKLYQIHRWDAIIDQTSSSPRPTLYIVPDEPFNVFCSQQKKLVVTISGTGTLYDNKPIYADAQPSELVGGFRPNFQEDTGFVGILLDTQWQGYPNVMGEVSIDGVHDGINVEQYQSANPCTHTSGSINTEHIRIIMMCIIIITIVVSLQN